MIPVSIPVIPVIPRSSNDERRSGVTDDRRYHSRRQYSTAADCDVADKCTAVVSLSGNNIDDLSLILRRPTAPRIDRLNSSITVELLAGDLIVHDACALLVCRSIYCMQHGLLVPVTLVYLYRQQNSQVSSHHNSAFKYLH